MEGGNYSLNYCLPETRYAPAEPKLHRPKHSLARNVFFSFPLQQKAPWFAGFALSCRANQPPITAAQPHVLFPVFSQLPSVSSTGKQGQTNEKQRLLSLAACFTPMETPLPSPRLLSLVLPSSFCRFPPGRLTAYQAVSSNDGQKTGEGPVFQWSFPPPKKLQGA